MSCAGKMRTASNLGDTVGVVELVIAGIAIRLQMAGETGQLPLGMCTGQIGDERVPDQRRHGGAEAAIVNGVDPEPAVAVLPRPGSSMRTGVSSVWIFEAVSPTSRIRLMIGSSSTDACMTQPASVERSISIPCAAMISAWRYSGR